MFQQLKPLLGKSPLAMMVALEGDQLRVTVEQKKAGKSGRHLNLSIVATADELDRDLIAEIVKQADGPVAAAAPIAEQVQQQIAASATEKPAKKAKPSKPVKKAKPTKAAKRTSGQKKHSKTGKSIAAQAAARKKPKKAAASSVKVTLPGKTKSAAPAPSARKPQAPHHANRPDKAACIADYIDSCPKATDTIKREDFLKKKGGTGRRFERLWGMSWHKFVAEAVAVRDKGASVPSTATKAPAAKSAKSTAPKANKGPAVSGAQLSMLPDSWPFPTQPKDVEEGRDKSNIKNGFDVYDENGVYFDYLGYQPELGEIVQLDMGETTMVRRKVFAIDGCRVMTVPATPPARPGTEPSQNTREDSGPAAAAANDEGAPVRVIKNAEGVLIAGGFQRHVKVGDVLKLGRNDWTVKHFTNDQIMVEPNKEAAAA